MKLNLGCGKDLRHNYSNIDLLDLNSDNYQRGDIRNLDWFCQDGSVEEILALDVLTFFNLDDIENTIKNWYEKLKFNGKLTISIVDMESVCCSFAINKLSIHDVNQLLIKNQSDNEPRKCILDKYAVEQTLKKMNFTILSKRFDNFMFYIEAQKE